MRLTTKGRYALRAVIYLARHSKDGNPVSIKAISAAEKISADFLEQIFFKLRRNGIVASMRGPGGGFYFTRPLASVSLLDILEAADEGFNFSPCMEEGAEPCEHQPVCAARAVWCELDEVIRSFARGRTLDVLSGMPYSSST